MSIKKCKSCAMEIPLEARKCPYCREPQQLSFLARVFLGMLALAAAGLCISFFVPDTPVDPYVAAETAREEEELSAKYAAQGFVEAQLKAPATAKWPPAKQFSARRFDFAGRSAWEISGYVDAQNSFGASIRTHFTTTVLKSENGWSHIETKMN